METADMFFLLQTNIRSFLNTMPGVIKQLTILKKNYEKTSVTM